MKRFINIIIILIALTFIGFFAYNMIISWHEEEIETARQQMREEMKPQEITPSTEKLLDAFGETPADDPSREKQITIADIERQIMAFFKYLDSQEYVAAYKLEGGTYQQYYQAIKGLSSNPPLIVGETESLHTLYRNMSHFFRVIGKTQIGLTKDVLKNESDILESAAATFYLWFTMNSASGETLKGRPSLEMLYRYSGFFLNTLSGRNYLLRRDSRTRILTTYYCILILDKANDAALNSGGIDIRPHIRSAAAEISIRGGFINKDHYLSELNRLEEKYQL